MAAPYWTNRLCRREEIDAVVDLVRVTYGAEHRESNRSFWEWRYLSETDFRADIFLAEHEGRPIGVFTVMMLDFQWGEQRLKGAMHSGLITHPDHRRRGVFRSLVEAINEHAARQGALFITSTPNDNSLPGFLKSGDWDYPAPVPVYLKVMHLPTLLRPKVGRVAGGLVGWLPQLFFRRRREPLGRRFDFQQVSLVPDELDEVCEEFARDCPMLMTRRTAAYWNWRYGIKPGADYRTLVARQAGRLMGAVATSTEDYRGLQVGLVLDLVTRGGLVGLRLLLRAAEDDLRSRGIGLITCQATSPILQRALGEERYWRPKTTWLPRRFHYIYRFTGIPGLPRRPTRLEDWHLTFGDSDNS